MSGDLVATIADLRLEHKWGRRPRSILDVMALAPNTFSYVPECSRGGDGPNTAIIITRLDHASHWSLEPHAAIQETRVSGPSGSFDLFTIGANYYMPK